VDLFDPVVKDRFNFSTDAGMSLFVIGDLDTPPQQQQQQQQQQQLFPSSSCWNHLTRPEDTTIGSWMQGLVFCGVDWQDQNCTAGTWSETEQAWTGAQASFWATVYAAFAQQVKGIVNLAVLPNVTTPTTLTAASPNAPSLRLLFETSALPNFRPTEILGFDIYAPDCQDPSVTVLKNKILQQHGLSSSPIRCISDPFWFHLDFCVGSGVHSDACHAISGQPSTARRPIPANMPSKNEHGRHHMAWFLVASGLALGVAMFVSEIKYHWFHAAVSEWRGNYERIPQSQYV
jgi:hypothetical protein